MNVALAIVAQGSQGGSVHGHERRPNILALLGARF